MAKINIGKFINNLDTEDLTSEKLQGIANNVYAKAISTHKKGQEITDDRLKDQDKETVEFVKDNHDRLANNDEEDEKLNKELNESYRELVPGDAIISKGERAVIGDILSQQVFKDSIDIEFKDVNGNYRTWKSDVDGGKVEYKEPLNEETNGASHAGLGKAIDVIKEGNKYTNDRGASIEVLSKAKDGDLQWLIKSSSDKDLGRIAKGSEETLRKTIADNGYKQDVSINESKDDKFKIFVEYTDGDVVVFDNITSEDWFNYLQPDLENDDKVVHYDAEKIIDENEFDVDNNSLNEEGGIQKFCIKVSSELVPSAGRNYITKDALQADDGYIDNLEDITDYKSYKKTLLFDSHDEAKEFITKLTEDFNCDVDDFKVEQFFHLGGTLLDSLTESVLSELELALKRLGKEKAAALEKYLEEVSPKENFNKYMDAARQLPSTPTGAADYEKLKKKFNVLTLDDVLYNEAEWNKFEDWLKKHSELLEHLDAGENEDIEDLENLDFDGVAEKTEETLEEDFDTKSSEESNMDLKELYEKEKEALLKEEKEPQGEEEAWKTNLREIQEKCIKEYRQFAGLKDGEAITEENINEKELGKVSSRNNYDVEDLRKVLIKGAMR